MNQPSGPVTWKKEGAVVRIGMNRPEKKNALTREMYDALDDALARVEADADARVMLLVGEGGNFTAGNDLKDFLEHPPEGKESPVFRFLHRLMTAKKPVVAAVEGVAVGIGTTALLHCDYVVAAEGTTFRMPFAPLGLCPEAASSLLVPRLVGHRRAVELLLLGRLFDPAEAEGFGIVNEVVLPGVAESRALAVAREIAALPAGAVLATKALLKRTALPEALDAFDAEGKLFCDLVRSEEAQAILTAFFKK